MKRLLDLAASIILVFLLSPITIILIMIIRFNLGSPVFFKQVRPGLNRKPIIVFKFRTMTNQCDANGILLPDEIRLTRFGIFLRKLSLDEVPQLINVIKGDLSLVGPRPLLMQYINRYTPEQARRHEVKPGITGWAQVNGRNAISWEQKFALDVWYVDNQSFWLDVKILCMTIRNVVKSEGITHNDHAAMPEFKG